MKSQSMKKKPHVQTGSDHAYWKTVTTLVKKPFCIFFKSRLTQFSEKKLQNTLQFVYLAYCGFMRHFILDAIILQINRY